MSATPANVISFGGPRTAIRGRGGNRGVGSSALQPLQAAPAQPSVPAPLSKSKVPRTSPTVQCSLDRIASSASSELNVQVSPLEREELMRRNLEREQQLPILAITRALINLYSIEIMRRVAVCTITSPEPKGLGSVNDPRMGSVGTNTKCPHCGSIDCAGHYGLIEFNQPIYNPLFIRRIISVLTCVCNECGGLLISESTMKSEGILRYSYETRLTALEKACAGRPCMRKETLPGGPIIRCKPNPVYVPSSAKEHDQIMYKLPKLPNEPESKEHFIKPISQVEGILRKISDRDAALMGFDSGVWELYRARGTLTYGIGAPPALGKEGDQYVDTDSYTIYHVHDGAWTVDYSPNRLFIGNGPPSSPTVPPDTDDANAYIDTDNNTLYKYKGGTHPRRMVMHGLLVTPPATRPPLFDGTIMTPDPLTSIYIKIVKDNNAIEGSPNIASAASELFSSVQRLMLNTERAKVGNRDFVSLSEKLQGKEGVLRSGMMGKRTDYCARTVLGPDADLRFGQISLPESWAPVLTKLVRVFALNKAYLQRLLEQGRVTHVQATRGRYKGMRRRVNTEHVLTLEDGDIVERWLQNGDRVTFNRQPTLHKQSLMGFEVVLKKQLTIGLHLSYTTPLNADFDGDEGNVWDPQDIMVEAEVAELMDVSHCIMSSQQNRPMIGLVYDAVTAAYILTDANTTVDDDLFNDCLLLITESSQLPTLYDRLKRYGVDPRSGRALFSALLPEDFVYISGDLFILDGVLVSGRVTKKHVGTTHRSIVQELWVSYGRERTAAFLTDAPFVLNRWLSERGFSVGPSDCMRIERRKVRVTDEEGNAQIKTVEVDVIDELMKEELTHTKVRIEALGGPLRDPLEEEYREKQIVGLLQSAKGIGVKIAKRAMIGGVSTQEITDDAVERMGRYLSSRLARHPDPSSVQGEIEEMMRELAQVIIQAPSDSFPAAETKRRMEEMATYLSQELQTEEQVLGAVNIAYSLVQRLHDEVSLPPNAIGIMSDEIGGGAKGALFNVAQIMGIVGQQFYRSRRLEATLTGGTRCLPTYDEDDPDPQARGLCTNSYWKGLTPTEMFFTMAGGREGLMDTAMKTSETGEMHHKMVKALENVKVHFDGSVRNTIGTVFQFLYGGDGYDAANLVRVSDKGGNSLASFIDLKSVATQLNIKHGWIPKQAGAKLGVAGAVYPAPPPISPIPRPQKVERERPLEPELRPLTRFERARVLGERAKQISEGSRPMVETQGEIDALRIANMELDAGVLPIKVKRVLPNGSVIEIKA